MFSAYCNCITLMKLLDGSLEYKVYNLCCTSMGPKNGSLGPAVSVKFISMPSNSFINIVQLQ